MIAGGGEGGSHSLILSRGGGSRVHYLKRGGELHTQFLPLEKRGGEGKISPSPSSLTNEERKEVQIATSHFPTEVEVGKTFLLTIIIEGKKGGEKRRKGIHKNLEKKYDLKILSDKDNKGSRIHSQSGKKRKGGKCLPSLRRKTTEF